jgi:DNA-directed RNA polymerase specialized sigma54-like protein
VVQSLEPPGVGARDIRECLLLQLERRSNLTAAQVLAKRILENCFTEFTKKHFEKIMGRLGISEEQFRAAIEEIQRLSPKPGNLYNEGGNIASPYVIPDFILDERDGELMLRLNSYNVPELKINRKYADMIRQMAHSSGNPSQEDKEALQFVKNKIDSAKWFISAIKQRQDTLMRTMQAIVDYRKSLSQQMETLAAQRAEVVKQMRRKDASPELADQRMALTCKIAELRKEDKIAEGAIKRIQRTRESNRIDQENRNQHTNNRNRCRNRSWQR